MAYSVADNSPTLGYIAWAGASISYDGVLSAIANGSTCRRYVYWLQASPLVFQTSDAYPVLAEQDCMVFINNGGIAHSVLDAEVIHGDMLIEGSIGARALSAGSVKADHIQAGAVHSDHIGAGTIDAEHMKIDSIEAGHIKSGSVETEKLKAGAVTAEKIYVKNLAAINGNLSVISGGIDDVFNYWCMSDFPGKPEERDVGELRAGDIFVYFKVDPGAAGTSLDPKIQLIAGPDFIKLTDDGIEFKTTIFDVQASVSSFTSGLDIVGRVTIGSDVAITSQAQLTLKSMGESGGPSFNDYASIAVMNGNNASKLADATLHLQTAGVLGGDPWISMHVLGSHGWAIGIDNQDELGNLKFNYLPTTPAANWGAVKIVFSPDGSAWFTGNITSSGAITATGLVNAPAFNLSGYCEWDTGGFDATGGGAAIVNDSTGYKALMILGNRSAGGSRIIKMWDNLIVSGNINATTITGTTVWGAVGNDYADALDLPHDDIAPGLVAMISSGRVRQCKSRSCDEAVGIVTDTYSFCAGRDGLPIAVAGFVLAHVDHKYKTGTRLTSSESGGLTLAIGCDRVLATFVSTVEETQWNGKPVGGRMLVKVM
ncbi:MAG: hypothetical protein A2Y38_18540 [Spirochaetes bacterium GWB1_59_5]|nr:MAG: hypothetical protein A2Y38_18540 [Spirochaetes bacterium GWB1_59_5]